MTENLSPINGGRYAETFKSVLGSTESDEDHELDANLALLEQYSSGLYDFVDCLLDDGFFQDFAITREDISGIRAGAITALVSIAKYVDTERFRSQFQHAD